MKNQPVRLRSRQATPTMDKLLPVVAGIHDPFTLKDIMAASSMPENPVRAALMSMKNRGWIENTGKRVGGFNGQTLWTRTRWFGTNRAAGVEHEQRSALDFIGNILAGWRVTP